MNKKLITIGLKALLFTFLAIIVSSTVNELILKIVVVSEDFNTIVILGFILTLLFSIYFCTMIILSKLEDIKNKNK